VGSIVVVGWILGLEGLKGLSGPITMKANTALAIIAAGASLLLLGDHAAARLVGRACAAIAGAIGLLTLSEHVVGWSLGIDELFFREVPGAIATTSPGRMGPNAAFSLTLAGLALWELYRGNARAIARAQLLAAAISVLAVVPLVGYVYGATQFYAVARITGIAPHTSLALLALALGILAARNNLGPIGALAGDAPHAAMARRLLVQAVALPVVLGYARLYGERHAWFDAGFGTSLFVVIMIVLLSATTWHSAVVEQRGDLVRRRIQQDRDDLLVRERAAREHAEQADRAKGEFIAAVSHELRTPLHAISGWTQVLRQPQLPESSRTKAIEAVARNTLALARLIQDLHDTSRIATGDVELARMRVSVNAVVEAAVESVMPLAAAKDITIVVTPATGSPAVTGDAHRLQQVLWNLLANAAKFSPNRSTIAVDVSTGDEASVSIRVCDVGDGIDPAFLPRVFDQFQQGPTAPRGAGSLGLGLYIAKHLVERHGGRIHAHSEGPGKGAEFTIVLPVANGGSAADASAAETRRGKSAAVV
jgi:signal transduction histidine kinase